MPTQNMIDPEQTLLSDDTVHPAGGMFVTLQRVADKSRRRLAASVGLSLMVGLSGLIILMMMFIWWQGAMWSSIGLGAVVIFITTYRCLRFRSSTRELVNHMEDMVGERNHQAFLAVGTHLMDFGATGIRDVEVILKPQDYDTVWFRLTVAPIGQVGTTIEAYCRFRRYKVPMDTSAWRCSDETGICINGQMVARRKVSGLLRVVCLSQVHTASKPPG